MDSAQVQAAKEALREAKDRDGGGHSSREEALLAALPHFEAALEEIERQHEAMRSLYTLNLGRHLNDLHEIDSHYAAYSDVSDAYNIIEEAAPVLAEVPQ